MSPTRAPPINALMVEDDPVFRELLRDAVAHTQPSVRLRECTRGGEALELLQDTNLSLDLALVDIGLPDVSGIEIIRALRRRFPEVPVMVITVLSSEHSLLSAIRAGASGYLLKGEAEESIGRSIKEMLNGHCPISPALARSLFRIAGAPQETAAASFALTARERETLQLLSKGRSYADVAALMGVALSTVQFNVRSIYRKLEVHSQMQAVSKARDSGLI